MLLSLSMYWEYDFALNWRHEHYNDIRLIDVANAYLLFVDR